ncbi:hypothetical protein QWY31_04370 [Cytophagales bacterium LB-30]|uniref:Uncharacterized protein n=1 Tax=Shiella aurantiaca TaxID=3058365 RepID=A0ABT8F2X0_9BACT|nr:hypothetical protein [Shiella aurantiaca]MDN4164723.1 hypothetical protein [Shiella aurantiaca]
MSSSAIVMMVSVMVLVSAITGYLFWRVLTASKKERTSVEDETEPMDT